MHVSMKKNSNKAITCWINLINFFKTLLIYDLNFLIYDDAIC
jgi:hypothetical protein